MENGEKKCGTAGLVILAFSAICFAKACMLRVEYPASSFLMVFSA
jgi:hypothetical protein